VDAIDAGELESLREAVARYDGQVVVTRAPADLRRTLDVWGPARGIEVMRRVKDQFDPDHRMSPGTFVGGL
jgi:glycolate oxidase FAD binding subunit